MAFQFRKGRSTIDALETITAIAERAGSGPYASCDLCALVAIDVANAFNSAPWSRINESLEAKNVPMYLRNVLGDNPRNRSLLTEAGGIPVTCGVP